MAPPIPRTAAGWRRVRQAKLQVLGGDPFAVDPAGYPGVRPEVVASWRRSMLAGVDPDAGRYVLDREFRPGTRLAAVAQPIMNRLRDDISGLHCWGFLADRDCRLLTLVVGDFPQAGRVHRQHLIPGMCFGEDLMGTNGLGCAHETQQPFVISGTEHFRTDAEILTTTGVVIRDPVTGRYAGTLGVHCLREHGTAAVLPLVAEIGRSIEARLPGRRDHGERALFEAFSAAQHRYRDPVVAVSERLFVVSTRARVLVHEADEGLLRDLAGESTTRGGKVLRTLSSGAPLTIEVIPVRQARGEFAAVLVLHPEGPGRQPAPDPTARFRRSLSRAARAGQPILLTGERGCGKRYEAKALLGKEIVELDGAIAHLAPRKWVRRLAAAVHAGKPVLLDHVTTLPPDLAATVAALVTGAKGPVVGTGPAEGGATGLREAFPILLTVPPLRERRSEFGALCAALLTGPGEGPVTLTPRAHAKLAAGDWPGNVRELRQVLAGARTRAHGPVLDVADLPARYGVGDPLDEVRAAERRVLLSALADCGGDRTSVAEMLGISRATVYRKLKRHELL